MSDPAEAPDWPDISEMVAAIEKASVALEETGNISVHFLQTAPLETLGTLAARRRDALQSCRDVLDRIKAMDAELRA